MGTPLTREVILDMLATILPIANKLGDLTTTKNLEPDLVAVYKLAWSLYNELHALLAVYDFYENL